MTENLSEREHKPRLINIGSRPPLRHRRGPDRYLMEMVRRAQPVFAGFDGIVRNKSTVPVVFRVADAPTPDGGYAFDVATLTLAEQPADGDIVTLNNGTDTFVFEFDNDGAVTLGNYAVEIHPEHLYRTFRNLWRVMRDLDANGAQAKGSIELTGNVADGNTVTVDDGSTSLVFEYDNNATITGDVAVDIGGTAEESLDNLIAAIAASALQVTATKTSASTASVENNNPGSAGNETLANSGANITTAGMVGGADAGSLLVDVEDASLLGARVPEPTPKLRLTHRTVGGGSGAALTTDVADAEVEDFAGASLVTFRTGGADVTTVTVQPGGNVSFAVEAASARYVAFYAIPADVDEGAPTPAEDPEVECSISYRYGELHRFGRSDANLMPREPYVAPYVE